MPAKSSPSHPHHASQVVRRLLWEEKYRVPDELLPKALGFLIGWRRKRKGWDAAWVARRCGRGPQTVRDLESGRYSRFAWLNAYAVCRVLHCSLARLERLVPRFLKHDQLRQERLHAGEPDWMVKMAKMGWTVSPDPRASPVKFPCSILRMPSPRPAETATEWMSCLST